MTKPKIAIACQGGGSQTAFTAGALKALCQAQIGEEFDIVEHQRHLGRGGVRDAGLVCLHEGRAAGVAAPDGFWQENTAQGPVELAINRFIVKSVRMVNAGMLPTLQLSPSSPVMQSLMEFMTAGQRKGFSDFRGLLESHIDFAEIASWGPRAEAAGADAGRRQRDQRRARQVRLAPASRSASSTSWRPARCPASFRRCRSARMPTGTACSPTIRRSRS